MKYTFETKIDEVAFDQFVENHPQNNLFQQTKWVQIKDNWAHLFSMVKQDEQIVATALVLIRKLPLGLTLWYIPRGPIMDYTNTELVTFTFDQLKKEATKGKAIAIRIDPQVYYHRYLYKNRKKDKEDLNLGVIQSLKDYGFKHKGFTTYISEATQPRFQGACESAEYESSLVGKTKKYIRQAYERGTYLDDQDVMMDFASAMHMTETKKSVALRNVDYYEKMKKVYGDHCFIMVAKIDLDKHSQEVKEALNQLAQQDTTGMSQKELDSHYKQVKDLTEELEKLKQNQAIDGSQGIISGILGCYNSNLMELFYMGNNPRYSYVHGSYALYDTCIMMAVKKGIKNVSFGGIEGSLDDGLTLFKSNFPMFVEEFIGEFDFVLKPFFYSCFDKGLPIVKKIMRRKK